MNKLLTSIKTIILPNKKINIFVTVILLLRITAGAIFAKTINLNDQNLVLEKIKLFIDNINNNRVSSITVLKNSLTINYIYIIIIWLCGMSLLGIIINIFLMFLKSFILGFSLAAFYITYKTKGIFLSLIYLLFGELITIIVITILTIYSIMFTIKLLKTILKQNNNISIRKFLKNYLVILLSSIILCFISSVCETFILPSIIKLIIKLYI